jgi:hypothetical protein
MRQRTVVRATTSPVASVISETKSCSASRLVSGIGQRASAVSVPRAFFKKEMDSATGMPRAPGGNHVVTASPLVTSPRLASAMA